MGYVFVSYSRKQLYFAESIVLSLQKAGLDIWFDLQKLSPGVDWSATLQDGYGHCESLIFVASQAAIQSPYVQVEWETALQNGREVIVVLTEAVILPASLRGCAVYDARLHFDQTIRRLIAYLKGEQPAQHDPIPTPGERFNLPLKMPFDIWLTLCILFMPTITIWITTLTIPFNSPELSIDLGLPKSTTVVVVYLFGLYYGFNRAQTRFPILKFWKHDASEEELERIRMSLLLTQVAAAAICYFLNVLLPKQDGLPLNPIGYLIFIFPLVSTYWSFWVAGHSPDILRWLPSGNADQDTRESIAMELTAAPQKIATQKAMDKEQALTLPTAFEPVTYAIHHHPADGYTAAFVESALRAGGCQPAPETQASVQLIVVSNRTSKQWLAEHTKSLSGQIIHALATNINTPPEIQPALQTQWIDLRSGRGKTVNALAAYLTRKDRASINYGMQVSPTSFDNNNGFPRLIRLLLGGFLILFILLFLAISNLWDLPNWLFIPCSIPLILYLDALVMRNASLPVLFHKMLGHRIAWFANSAPFAPDPIGNTDRKYLANLKSFLLIDQE